MLEHAFLFLKVCCLQTVNALLIKLEQGSIHIHKYFYAIILPKLWNVAILSLGICFASPFS